MGLVFSEEELVPKRRVPEKQKQSWKDEGPSKKVKIPVGGKILEVEEDPGDQRAAWKRMPGDAQRP